MFSPVQNITKQHAIRVVQQIHATLLLALPALYCIVYSAIQPLKSASVLNKISFSFSILCGAGSLQLSGVRLSVCPSVCPIRLRVCCCGPGRQETSIDCCTTGGLAVSSSSSGLGQRHVVSCQAIIIKFCLDKELLLYT